MPNDNHITLAPIDLHQQGTTFSKLNLNHPQQFKQPNPNLCCNRISTLLLGQSFILGFRIQISYDFPFFEFNSSVHLTNNILAKALVGLTHCWFPTRICYTQSSLKHQIAFVGLAHFRIPTRINNTQSLKHQLALLGLTHVRFRTRIHHTQSLNHQVNFWV